jgi:calcineurin-like phosphoesterase family protein
MSVYAPSGAYQPHLDIRCSGDRVPNWARPLTEGRPPNGTAWLVVMGRRAGKSWLASGVARARLAGSTHRVDLRDSPAKVKKAGLACLRGAKAAPGITDGVLLIDEPALSEDRHLGIDAAALANGLERTRAAGVIPVVFMTPHEYSVLIGHLGPDARKDVIVPPVLDEGEIGRMTARAPNWAPEVAAALGENQPVWLQTPFLLELVLRTAEERPELRPDIPALLAAATGEASIRHQYREQLFGNGLTARQRAELRAGRWRTAGVVVPDAAPSDPLAMTPIPADPVIAAHLPEVLRIHHVSDLHQGGSLRAMVDAKDHGGAGRGLAGLAGEGTPLDSYLGHVRRLAAEGTAPHLVVVSGDVVNRPDDEQGRQALDWLKSLGSLLAEHRDLRPGDPRIVLVGGNHDVSWDLCLDERREARHEWFAATFKDYPHPELNLPDRGARRLFVNYPGAGLRIALLGSAESGGEPAHDADRDLLEFFRQRLASANDEEVRALIRSFERVDPGIIAREILDRLMPSEGYLTMAALHHPVSPVPTVEVAPYSGIVNAGQVKRALIAAGTALVLHGHTHLSFLAAERLLGPARPWTMRIAGAATLASAATDEQNGYNEILVSREGGTHRLLVRPIRLDGGQWVPQPGIAFRPGAPDECTLSDLARDHDR